MPAPWKHGPAVTEDEGGWRPVFSSTNRAFAEGYVTPQRLDKTGIDRVVACFAQAAQRTLAAGFELIEIHAAHGYLLHQFLSPITNDRTDEYGGSFENRTRALRQVVEAVRKVWAERLPLWVRISANDWVEGGWTIEDSVALTRELKKLGVDLMDCSSGGISPKARIPVASGYQVPFAERVRREAGISTGAVGMITAPEQAEQIITNSQADVVLLARELLRDPYWPLHAASELGVDVEWPVQYARAKR
jgi:2,4-dienoyl-CoA reductase-like NADH-dependent reductase (Old Yellow Enzyme family)